MVDHLELPILEANSCELETQPVDERTMRSIQQNYQIDHQEEFVKLKTQVEALLTQLRAFTGHQSEEAEFNL